LSPGFNRRGAIVAAGARVRLAMQHGWLPARTSRSISLTAGG
jgi:hypothetical protein